MANQIPVVLLKTRSQPEDKYHDYFADTPVSLGERLSFAPHFVPVLEHWQNQTSMKRLAELLKTGNLKREYGGMIFTSQRAVEAWCDVVKGVEQELAREAQNQSGTGKSTSSASAKDDVEPYLRFPIYTVGPATDSALRMLLDASQSLPSSPFASLNVSLHGAHTGYGAALAKYILEHYSIIHAHEWFTFYEAARLPFIPLLGPGNTYSRRRLEPDDPRLQKKPLLFVTGETRRDIIPKTLMNDEQKEKKIMVEEVEIYSTEVMSSFREDFRKLVAELKPQVHDQAVSNIVVIVVFSPQGSKEMLQVLGYVDEEGAVTQMAKQRETASTQLDGQTQYVIATIGPTTRDFLKEKLGFDADICATSPSPEGLGQVINDFLAGISAEKSLQ